jgi:hypothetical protein
LAATITTSVLVMVLATLLIGPVAVFSARADAVRPAIFSLRRMSARSWLQASTGREGARGTG